MIDDDTARIIVNIMVRELDIDRETQVMFLYSDGLKVTGCIRDLKCCLEALKDIDSKPYKDELEKDPGVNSFRVLCFDATDGNTKVGHFLLFSGKGGSA